MFVHSALELVQSNGLTHCLERSDARALYSSVIIGLGYLHNYSYFANILKFMLIFL
jgi:hypothetical protein